MREQRNSRYFKEEEDEMDTSAGLSAPSFGGKLNLSSFAFSSNISPPPTDTATLRRSSRNSSSTTSTPLPSPTPSPLKRKLPSSSTKSTTASPSPNKKPRSHSRPPSSYAPPSLYSHLPPPLPDVLAPNLICLFIGLNPGLRTSLSGHAYAHPSNLFWKLLYSSGCTTRLLHPSDDVRLPELYSLGNTNIVSRPTRNGAELSKHEMDEGVKVLEEKIRRWRPETVALVGKGIWESVWRVRRGRGLRKEEFRYGWQGEGENLGAVEGWGGARVFVASSTSGLAATLLPVEKERIWRELGSWVEKRREERLERDRFMEESIDDDI